MAVIFLGPDPAMPDPSAATPEGLVAVGGDLSPERLVNAYRRGIFPWYDDSSPILWWSPDPRLVLFPENLKVSKSMNRLLKKNAFDVTYDRDFSGVIKACRKIERPGQEGTWITPAMEKAYILLHELGIARSAEVWQDGRLAGGLYGIRLGNVFFGESMFSKTDNASKYGFISWVRKMQGEGVKLIDCQVTTAHLVSLGAEEISRKAFLEILSRYSR